MIDWSSIKTTREDRAAIGCIADRFFFLGGSGDKAALKMDLLAAHHACPMDLGRLAEAPDHDLAHDVGEIVRHLDRESGTLPDWFHPRYAKPKAGLAASH